MSKDPAFLFYPGDWNLGTMHMTLEEKGAYIDLLMLQFARDKFTLAQAEHMLNGSFSKIWDVVSEKFKTDGTFYWNERLKIEKEKRAKFTESRRLNALNPKKEGEDMQEHMQVHMEDINKDVNNSNNGVKKFTAPLKEEVTNYFKEKGYKPEVGARAWESYDVANWHDSKGQKIRNWKQKMINVWFKDENKIVIRPQDKLL